MPGTLSFQDNFWESPQKHGVTALINLTRDAKQATEKLLHVYEARATLEQDYGLRLKEIASTLNKPVDTTPIGSSFASSQDELIKTADARLELSQNLKAHVTDPLTKFLERQRQFWNTLRETVKQGGLYHQRRLMVEYVLNVRERYNAEWEKTNAACQTGGRGDRRSIQRASEKRKLDMLAQNYEKALSDLTQVATDWNEQWRVICNECQQLEEERAVLLKECFIQYGNVLQDPLDLMHEACVSIRHTAGAIDPNAYVDEIVSVHGTGSEVPSALDYITLYVNRDKKPDEQGEKDRETPGTAYSPRLEKATFTPLTLNHTEHNQPAQTGVGAGEDQSSTFVISRVEVYGSDEEDEEDVDNDNDNDNDEGYCVVDNTQDVYSMEDGSVASHRLTEESPYAREPTNPSPSYYEPKGLTQHQSPSLRSIPDTSYHREQATPPLPEREVAGSVRSNSPAKQVSFSESSRLYASPVKSQDPVQARPAPEVPPKNSPLSRSPQVAPRQDDTIFPIYDDPMPTLPDDRNLSPHTLRPTVHEELDDMLQELQTQNQKGAVSRSSSRIRLSGVRPPKQSSRWRDTASEAPSQEQPAVSKQSSSTTTSSHTSLGSLDATGGAISFREKLVADRKATAFETRDTMQIHSSLASREPSRSPEPSAPKEPAKEPAPSSAVASAVASASLGTKPMPAATSPYIDKVVTLYRYDADDDDELSFEKGQILDISEKREGGWWMAHLSSHPSRQGLIPSNFVRHVDN